MTKPKPPERYGRLEKASGGAHAAVAHSIGSRIVGGEFPAGSILPNEAAWSEEFGVSRSVVREAIKMLSAKGLLTSRPKIGSRVAPRDRWNMLDQEVLSWYAESPNQTKILRSLQEFRHIFEPEAAALAAKKRSEAQMARITAACEAMGKARSMPERSAADVAFHFAILEASGNELLLPLGFLVESTLDKLFLMINRVAGDLMHAQELHIAIESAIREQNPDRARQAVRHLLYNSDAYIDKLETLTKDPDLRITAAGD